MKGRNLINMSDGCTYVVYVSILISLCLLQCNSQATECTGDPSLCGGNSRCNDDGICSCNNNFMSPSGSQSDCIDLRIENSNCTTDSCAYCPELLNCLSCISGYALLMENNAKSCVRICPNGYSLEASTGIDVTFAIAMCEQQDSDGSSSSGVSGVYIGIIIGVSVIVILIIIAMIVYCIYAINKGRVRQTFDITDENATNEINAHQNEAFLDNEQADMEDENDCDDYLALADGDGEKAQFLQKLAKLRKQSSVFLRMLNDMRRRLKELPPDATAAKSYKNVMQDVTRLLYLLNKKPHNVQMPPDGMQLLNWSEEILRRYLQSQQQRTSISRISTYGQQAETHF